MQKDLAESHSKVELAHVTDYCIQSNGQGKSGTVQGQIRLLSEEKDRMHRDSLSLQKQLDYYKVNPNWDHADDRVRLNRCKRRWRRQTMCYRKRWHWRDKWSPFKYPAYVNITYSSWSWKMNDVPLFEHQRLRRTRATLKSRCKRRSQSWKHNWANRLNWQKRPKQKQPK